MVLKKKLVQENVGVSWWTEEDRQAWKLLVTSLQHDWEDRGVKKLMEKFQKSALISLPIFSQTPFR